MSYCQKTSPRISLPYHSLLFLTLVTLQLSPLFLKVKSSLKYSQKFPPWAIQGLLFLLITAPNLAMPENNILRNDAQYSPSSLNILKAYEPDRVPPIVYNKCAYLSKHAIWKGTRNTCKTLLGKSIICKSHR